jgi:proteasome alpha subunit
VRTAVAALGRDGNETRELEPAQLEVAVLDRNRKQDRKFRRLVGSQLARLLADEPGAEAAIAENGNGNGNGESGAHEDAGSTAGSQGDLLDDVDEALDGEDGGES